MVEGKDFIRGRELNFWEKEVEDAWWSRRALTRDVRNAGQSKTCCLVVQREAVDEANTP